MQPGRVPLIQTMRERFPTNNADNEFLPAIKKAPEPGVEPDATAALEKCHLNKITAFVFDGFYF